VRLRERISATFAFVTIAAAVFLLGCAFRWAEATIAILVVLAILPLLLSRRGFSRIPPLIALLGAAAALTVLQLVPLPESILHTVQPVGSALRSDGAAIVGTSPWQALTLDAPGSLRALCFFVILIGVAWISLRMTVTSSGRYRVLVAIGAVCGATAVVTGVHDLVGARELYGVYAPQFGKPTLLGPLLNTNHLGCLMALGAMVCMGLALYPRQRSWLRVLWLVAVVGCSVVAVATRSRGATLALIVGGLLTVGVLLAQRVFGAERRTRGSFLTTSIPVAVVVLSAIVVVVYASAGGVSSELSRTSFEEVQNPHSKFAIWRAASQLIDESRWFGVGRGAFEAAVTHTHPSAAVASFSHVENEYIQTVVDWGIVGACILGAGLVWLVVSGFRSWSDGPLAAGAIGGIAVVALQSVVDFGVELLGLAVPLTALLATLTYVPLRELDGRRKRIAAGLRIAQVAALATAAVLLLGASTTSIAEDHAALRGRDLKFEDLHDSLERHPLDYYGYALAAQALYRNPDPRRGVRVLNHALRLHPTHPGIHHMAARALRSSGQLDQAAIEFGAALRGTAISQPILEEIIRTLPPKQAASAIPVDVPDFDLVVKRLVELGGSSEIATMYLSRFLDLRPNNIRACDLLYALAIRDQDVRAAEHASRKCSEHALAQESRVALAEMLLRERRYTEALRTIRDAETWEGHIDLRVRGWLTECDVYAAQEHWDEAKRCVRKLDGSGLITPERRDEITKRLERIEEQIRGQR